MNWRSFSVKTCKNCYQIIVTYKQLKKKSKILPTYFAPYASKVVINCHMIVVIGGAWGHVPQHFFLQWRAIQTALLAVYDIKWGHFEGAKLTLKMLPASWYSKYLFKRFRSFNIVKMGSVGQRASKLLAVKVGGLKKKSAIWPRPLSNQSAWIRVVPGSNHSQSLMAGNFAALWPTDPKFLEFKDLNLKKLF